MNTNYKILLIFPPPASPVSPYLSCPLLAGQLKAAGYITQSLDLSLDFFYYILNSQFLKNSYKKALTKFDEYKKNYNLKLSAQKTKDVIYKYLEKKLENKDEYLKIINNIDENIKKYKDKEIFYNINLIDDIAKQIYVAFEIAMLPYYPAKCSFYLYKNSKFKINSAGILAQTDFNTNENIFHSFYVEKIKEHNINKYDLVCISCPNLTQIIPTLTLTRLLKERYNTKICIGGNIISRIDCELKQMPELFDKFFDYILIGPGEGSIVKLADYLSNKDKSLNINGLLYKKNNEIISNKPDLNYNINKSHIMSLDGLNLDKYFTPDIIMPIQASKGCYWGKCTFCGLHYPKKKYTIKTPKKIVDEIEFLNKKYNINIFEFVDEAIHPGYLSKIADEIIKRALNIKYVCCARMEENFYSDKLCNKLYKSGLRLIEFGFETNSKRIYKCINKGIKFENRNKILENCVNAGIFTYIYAIIGYPSETKDEALETLLYAKKNKSFVDNMFIHQFWLDKKAPAYKKYKSIGISNINIDRNNCFSQYYQYNCNKGMKVEEIKNLLAKNREENKLLNHLFFAPDEYFFLYVLHYGREKVKEII